MEGQELLQLEALAVGHPKIGMSDQFILQNTSSNSVELVEAATL